MRLNELIFSPEDLIPRDFFEEIPVKVPRKTLLELPREEQKRLESLLAALQGKIEESRTVMSWLEGSKRFAMAQRFVEENYPHVAKRLGGLRNFKIPEGQDTVIEAAFSRAYDALYTIAQMALGRYIRLAEPYTFGTPNNGVQYEWRRGEVQFHLEIIPGKGEPRYGYLLWPSLSLDDGKEGEFVGPLNESSVIKEFLGWVEKGSL
jgi:hypothetical protein